MIAKTFIKDRLLRDKSGIPIGRCVLADSDDYQEGLPFFAALVTLPKIYFDANSHIYIDGLAYKIPKDIPPIRKSIRGPNRVLNSITLTPDPSV